VPAKFTRKERDIETGLDFFEARYFASTQGRFTSTDPVTLTVERLVDPQRINLYAYCRNNPLAFVDPFGEDILMTGTEEDQKRGLNRLRNQLGQERFDLVDYNQQYVEGVGNVTVVNFGSEQNRAKFEAIGGDDKNERQYSSTMADIIGATQHVEYRVAVHFSYKGIGIGNWRENVKTTVYAYGGAATVDTVESWTGNVQIFIAPDATYKAFENMATDHKNGIKKSNDGDLLTFTQEQIDAHEFGHAWSRIKLGLPVSSPGRALRMENIMRIRQKSTNIRIAH
jgi:RHS repeat-associated protein